MAESKPKLPKNSEISEPEGSDRRGFLAATAFLTGAVCTLAPVGAAAVFVLDPILRKKEDAAAGDGFIKVATLDMLPDDGTPVAAKVIDDRRDAWNLERNAEIGTVYLRKMGENLVCFSAICPHMGCFVQFKEESFHCPCHNSQFDIDGQTTNKIPPRPLDTLECRVDGNDVLVKYESFLAGIHDKVVV